jgi:hypothetical protein
MTVPVTTQPNNEPRLLDQTHISLNLFDTILKTATTWFELERSWATTERDINIQEQLEARQWQLRNQPYLPLPKVDISSFFTPHSLLDS